MNVEDRKKCKINWLVGSFWCMMSGAYSLLTCECACDDSTVRPQIMLGNNSYVLNMHIHVVWMFF